MPTVNGINSDEFSREDLIRAVKVSKFFSQIFATNVSVDAFTQIAVLYGVQAPNTFSDMTFSSPNGMELRLSSSGEGVTLTNGAGATIRLASGNVEIIGSGVSFDISGRPIVTGSRSSGAALQSLLTELAGIGLITNSTTA